MPDRRAHVTLDVRLDRPTATAREAALRQTCAAEDVKTTAGTKCIFRPRSDKAVFASCSPASFSRRSAFLFSPNPMQLLRNTVSSYDY